MSNAPSKPVSFSRPKVGYFSNRPRIHTHTHTHTKLQKLFVAGSLKRWKAIEKVTGLQIPPMSKCESQQSNEEIQVLE